MVELGIILENFLWILAIALICYCFYVLGIYYTFSKQPQLSKICPQLENIETETKEESEYKKLRLLLVEALEDA